MQSIAFLILTAVSAAESYCDTPCPKDFASQQLILYKNSTTTVPCQTTRSGATVDCIDGSVTLNRNLIVNTNFMDIVTSLVRERIPERRVHAKGAGAFGYFEVTNNISDICKAKVFSEDGKITRVAVRFSTSFREPGSADTIREGKGFALKFYTEQGIFDLVCVHIQTFFLKDPLFFAAHARAQGRNPGTNLRDPTMLWDFLTKRPETFLFQVLVSGDIGITDGYRYMPGFAYHTYQVVNDFGESYFVRFHILPVDGIKTLSSAAAKQLTADDPDYATRDLYDAIAAGNYPKWDVKIQVLTLDDVRNATFNVFDITKILPEDIYPLRDLGRFVLNENPNNYFAQIEQLAFNPGNLVSGILGAPDKTFESRRMSYRDAQLYRLGANFRNIPVNCPLFYTNPYVRDGVPPVRDNKKGTPNYFPNSFNGPVPCSDGNKVELLDITETTTADNFDQASDVYNAMTEDERTRLIENLLDTLGCAERFIQDRAVQIFTDINSDLGQRVQTGLTINRTTCNYF